MRGGQPASPAAFALVRHPAQTVMTHQSRDSLGLATHPEPEAELGVDARGPVGPARLGVDRNDRGGQVLVGDLTGTWRPAGGFVEPRP